MPATAESLRAGRWPRANRRWLIGPLLLLVGIPLAMLVTSWSQPQPDIWQHLSRWLLPRLVGHTVLMMVVVGLGVAVLGVGLAWLSACCDYPLRRILDPLLVLPLAFPTYVLAFIYLGMLDYTGPAQTAWRAWFDTTPALLEALSRPGGVLFILVLAFYPYVYLLARAAFAGGGLAAFEASRSLGLGPVRTFFRVSLPMSPPAVVAGLALALMEALADFGAVAIYGFDTFTTAIYRTWLGMFNLTAAVQLASILMLFVLLLLGAERLSRSPRVARTGRRTTGHRIRLGGARGWAASVFQIVVVLVGVVLPLIQLLVWVGPQLDELVNARLLRVVFNTMVFGLSGAVAVVIGGLVLLAATHRTSRRQALLGEMAALGYAIPGTVLAVAIMFAVLRFDQLAGTALAGGMAALVMAYTIRFIRVAWGPLDSVAGRIRPQYIEAARSLGVSRWQRIWRISLPLLRPGLMTAFLLALVEVAKEMPATLMLRPFGRETLAVLIYELTAEGQWQMAAAPALILVVLGAMPVVVLIRSGRLRAI